MLWLKTLYEAVGLPKLNRVVIGGDFCEPIGRAVMVCARHAHLAAELSHRAGDAEIVGRDDDLRDACRRRRAPVDVLDHRAAADVGERLAREAR